MNITHTHIDPATLQTFCETEIRRKVEANDTSLFRVPTQTSHKDQVTLLMLQAAVGINNAYTYLEVGSHLGGTLCPHLLDPSCRLAISVDPRPSSQPDERGRRFDYLDNSTARMLTELSTRMPAEMLRKLITFECDASELRTQTIPERVDLVLIDGEHTNRAAFRDFLSILPLVKDDAIIAFHDAQLIHDAIFNIESMLHYIDKSFYGCFALDNVYAMGLGIRSDLVKNSLRSMRHDTDTFLNYARHQVHQHIAFYYPIEWLKSTCRNFFRKAASRQER
jgi:hypothetical protein